VTLTALSPQERAVLQKRTLNTLMVGQIIGAAALASAVTVGAYVVQDILGDTTPWGGIATATATMGTAVMAQVLSRIMMRRGRRPGLQLSAQFSPLSVHNTDRLHFSWLACFSSVMVKHQTCWHDTPQLT
jgi:hypothetical protein